MSERRHDDGSVERPKSSAARRARLERELRANLLKRKAQTRARKATPAPRDGGRQTRG